MRRAVRRTSTIVSVLSLVAVGAGSIATAAPCAPVPTVSDRCPSWASIYNHPGGRGGKGEDIPRAVVASADGSRVFVTGVSYDASSGADATTVGIDATTGAQIWSNRSSAAGPTGYDTGSAVDVTPDGRTVVVTGRSSLTGGLDTDFDWWTNAYNASTGDTVWSRRYEGEHDPNEDFPTAVAISPDGRLAFVTGWETTDTGDINILVIAYRIADGETEWEARYDGPAQDHDLGYAIDTSPDGQTVYVAGESGGLSSGSDAVLLALDATGGEQAWIHRYDAANRRDVAEELSISADGSRIAIGGSTLAANARTDMLAVVVSSAGERAWAKTVTGPGTTGDGAGSDFVAGLAFGPTGDLYVGGTRVDTLQDGGSNFVVFAYDQAGNQRWSATQNSVAYFVDTALGLTVTPDGRRVYITGYYVVPRGEIQPIFKIEPGGSMTVAYDAASGTRAWISRYTESVVGAAVPAVNQPLAAGPASNRIYLASTFVTSGVYVYPTEAAYAYAYDYGVLAFDP